MKISIPGGERLAFGAAIGGLELEDLVEGPMGVDGPGFACPFEGLMLVRRDPYEVVGAVVGAVAVQVVTMLPGSGKSPESGAYKAVDRIISSSNIHMRIDLSAVTTGGVMVAGLSLCRTKARLERFAVRIENLAKIGGVVRFSAN